MGISDWSSDVCSSDLPRGLRRGQDAQIGRRTRHRDRRAAAGAGGGGGRSADAALRHERRGYPRRRDPARPRHAPAPYRERLDRVTSRRRAPTCPTRSEEHTSELQSLMRTSYAVFCLKKKKKKNK